MYAVLGAQSALHVVVWQMCEPSSVAADRKGFKACSNRLRNTSRPGHAQLVRPPIFVDFLVKRGEKFPCLQGCGLF